jgi:hypothetical protein
VGGEIEPNGLELSRLKTFVHLTAEKLWEPEAEIKSRDESSGDFH